MPLPHSVVVTGRRRFSWRSVVAAVAVSAVLVAAGLLVGTAIRPARDSAPAGDRRSAQTAIVARATLVDFVAAPGVLAFGPRQLIESRLSGTVTALPPVGTIVDRGQELFRIDDKPVILLFGALPAYRELGAGRAAVPAGEAPPAEVPASTGADVKQLKENLKALGYSGVPVDDRYTTQTAMVVRRWQKDLGIDQTGTVELGRVFYAPGPVRVAEHKLAPGAVAAGPVLACTGSTRLVVAEIKETDQELAKPGTPVRVALPGGKELGGTVRSVGPREDDTSVAGQPRTLDAVVAPNDPAAVDGLDSGSATVRFVRQERRDVLVVPIGALLALAEGGYGLEILQGGRTRVVAVRTGLFAGGKVEVSGAGIREGMTVGTAR